MAVLAPAVPSNAWPATNGCWSTTPRKFFRRHTDWPNSRPACWRLLRALVTEPAHEVSGRTATDRLLYRSDLSYTWTSSSASLSKSHGRICSGKSGFMAAPACPWPRVALASKTVRAGWPTLRYCRSCYSGGPFAQSLSARADSMI